MTTDVETLRASIAETNAALSQKVKVLESNVKEAANSIKDTVEQGAANVRSVTNAISPVHQLKEHPYLMTAALLGLGVYLGTRSRDRKSVSSESTEDRYTQTSFSNQAIETEIMAPSKIRAIAEPAALGIFAAVAGEVVKKYFPKIEDKTTAIQSAFIGQMTDRIIKEFS